MPCSHETRAAWLDGLISLSHHAVLYANCPLTQVYELPLSVVNGFFDGKTFKDWRKAQESEAKIKVAVVDRLNGVISAVGVVVKALGNLGRR